MPVQQVPGEHHALRIPEKAKYIEIAGVQPGSQGPLRIPKQPRSQKQREKSLGPLQHNCSHASWTCPPPSVWEYGFQTQSCQPQWAFHLAFKSPLAISCSHFVFSRSKLYQKWFCWTLQITNPVDTRALISLLKSKLRYGPGGHWTKTEVAGSSTAIILSRWQSRVRIENDSILHLNNASMDLSLDIESEPDPGCHVLTLFAIIHKLVSGVWISNVNDNLSVKK